MYEYALPVGCSITAPVFAQGWEWITFISSLLLWYCTLQPEQSY
jgi:hypothetical protein